MKKFDQSLANRAFRNFGLTRAIWLIAVSFLLPRVATIVVPP
jgi:hypothetical protein